MRRLLLAALALCAAQPAFAWGQTGHRITGAVADNYLSPRARAAVKDVLGSQTLAEVANWPDVMRSTPDPFWQTQSLPFHYVTIPVGQSYEAVGPPPEGDAITALTRFSAIAKDLKQPLAERQKALKFVIHIVGDLAQPLHVGQPGDRGGNDVRVGFFGAPANLHSIWDTSLIEHHGLSYSEWTAWTVRGVTSDQLRDWSVAEPSQWLADSAAERAAIYPAAGETDLRYSYVFQQTDRLHRQLAKGGLRLAAYLNRLFDAGDGAKTP